MATSITLVNPCLATTISGPTLVNKSVILNSSSPLIYNPGSFTDSVSAANGDPDFCGGMQFEYWRTDTNNQLIGLVFDQSNGDWHIQALSPFFIVETIPVEVRVKVAHVLAADVQQTFTFTVTVTPCVENSIQTEMGG